MKYSEAKKLIEELSDSYRTNIGTNKDFNVFYKDELMFWVSKEECDITTVPHAKLKKAPYLKRLYMILVDLTITPYEDRKNQNKFYIHALKGHSGYLCITPSNEIVFSNKYINLYKCDFTDSEIENLKQRQDVPLDWIKVELEPVN